MSTLARTLLGAGIGGVLFAVAAFFAAPDHAASTLALGAGTGLVIGAFVGLTGWIR